MPIAKQERILVLDNYDSFTYNLTHLIEKVSDVPFDVVRNDKISLEEIDNYSRIVLSPGPGLPKDAGIMPDLLNTYAFTKSIFGVCLGMQAIAERFGGSLKNLDTVVHGLAIPVKIVSEDVIFRNCPAEFKVGRYHSWVLENRKVPDELVVTAVDEQDHIMAIKHRDLNIRGVQFHPESILSEYGERIISNWMNSH